VSDVENERPSVAGHSVSGDDRANDREENPLNHRQQWMLLKLAQGKAVAADEIMMEFDVSDSTARRDIAGLRKSGLVAFEGPFKKGRYVLLRGGGDPPAE
jgi:predicted DNA-binding transcriptional regulator YafY